jgi:hypothetical protein
MSEKSPRRSGGKTPYPGREPFLFAVTQIVYE